MRKIRFASLKSNKGKRGSYRVCYAYFESETKVLLLTLYPKNEQVTLTGEQKAIIKSLIRDIENDLRKNWKAGDS